LSDIYLKIDQGNRQHEVLNYQDTVVEQQLNSYEFTDIAQQYDVWLIAGLPFQIGDLYYSVQALDISSTCVVLVLSNSDSLAGNKSETDLLQLNETLEHQVEGTAEELQLTIDRLQRTQKDLVNTEKAKSLSHFTAGIAHEINNPIGFIRGNLSFIGKVTSEVLDALSSLSDDRFKKPKLMLSEVDSVIDESVEGLDRVSNIISMLQPLNKLSDESAQEFDVIESIEFFIMGLEEGADIVSLIKPNKKIQVNLPLQVFTLALENVVSNALDAVSDVEDGFVRIEIFINDTDFGVKVTDNGIGIAPDQISIIFNPFYTTKPVGKGVGLGLSLSENLLKMINADIKVESNLGSGTEVYIHFPKGAMCGE